MLDAVVIGGGVAGLTAALVAARHGLETLVLLPMVPGGQLTTIDRVEDMPGFVDAIPGFELGPRIQEQAANAGTAFQMAEATELTEIEGGWRVAAGDEGFETRTVIVATGSRIRSLGVPGEERLRGRGVSQCASCDGPLMRGKPVVVVGAGDSGLQEALVLIMFASRVLVVDRAAESSAQATYRSRVAADARIAVRPNTLVDEIIGEQTVTAICIRDALSGETTTEEAAGIFVYAGLEPNTDLVRDLVDLDADGRIPTDIWMRTERRGLLAAGDVRSGSACQAISAAGDGATAAVAAYRFVRDGEWRAHG